MKVFVLMTGLALAHGAAALEREPADNGVQQEVVGALAQRADAKSLATAAALRAFVQTGMDPAGAVPLPSALSLIARASELAPQDAGISWLNLQLCEASPTCDSRDAATAMRWVDPDNSAAWMSLLAAAQRDKDVIEVDRVLADMARGTRFDLYWNEVVVMMFDALKGAQSALPRNYTASDSQRFTQLTGVAAAEVLPRFSPLADACRDPAPKSMRHEDCLKLSKIMQRGDAVIAQMAGFSIERHLFPPESKEARLITERRQLLEWRTTAAAQLDYPVMPWTKNSRARARLAEMRLRPREEDVCIALLRDHKIALEPKETHR